jgi:hypothetical protein
MIVVSKNQTSRRPKEKATLKKLLLSKIEAKGYRFSIGPQL